MFFNILLFYYKKYFQTKLYVKHEQIDFSQWKKFLHQKINYSIYDPLLYLWSIYIYTHIYIFFHWNQIIRNRIEFSCKKIFPRKINNVKIFVIIYHFYQHLIDWKIYYIYFYYCFFQFIIEKKIAICNFNNVSKRTISKRNIISSLISLS